MFDIARSVTAMVLAGGPGSRLMPLTRDRAKPAVPFAARLRLIDIVLSNCLHSGIRHIQVVPQYKSQSLYRHVNNGWEHLFRPEMNEYLQSIPPQMRIGDDWYRGTADCVFQNLYTLAMDDPKYVLILGADHIYKMDYSLMIEQHIRTGADLTIAAVPVGRAEASGFGVLGIDPKKRIKTFREKPKNPRAIPGRPDEFLASMGVYVFSSRTMVEELKRCLAVRRRQYDFGKHVIPGYLKADRKVYAYLFEDEKHVPCYWRDVGTIDAYYEASMDLLSTVPRFNLYDDDWHWHSVNRSLPSAKVTFHADFRGAILSDGCVLDDCAVTHSILSPGVRVGQGAVIEDSIIMDDVRIGEGAVIHRAIIDKRVVIPPGAVIRAGEMSYNGEYEVTESGSRIVIVPQPKLDWQGR